MNNLIMISGKDEHDKYICFSDLTVSSYACVINQNFKLHSNYQCSCMYGCVLGRLDSYGAGNCICFNIRIVCLLLGSGSPLSVLRPQSARSSEGRQTPLSPTSLVTRSDWYYNTF